MFIRFATKLNLDLLIAPWYRGEGVALTFHRVLSEADRSPWTGLRGLEVTKHLFTEVLNYFVTQKFTFLSAAQLAESISNGQIPAKFVIITFDDGYKDNAEYVAEEMRRRKLPWTLFVSTAFPDGSLKAWWYAIPHLLKGGRKMDLGALGGPSIETVGLSQSALDKLYSQLRDFFYGRWSSPKNREAVGHWFEQMGIDLAAVSVGLPMSWNSLKRIADEGCDIGAHTLNHPNLMKLNDAEASYEMAFGKERLSEMLKRPINTFAYPFGDRGSAGQREFDLANRAGFGIAFTTRNGWIFGQHLQNRFCLPRVNVSGSFRDFSDFRSRLNGFAALRESGSRRVVTL